MVLNRIKQRNVLVCISQDSEGYVYCGYFITLDFSFFLFFNSSVNLANGVSLFFVLQNQVVSVAIYRFLLLVT